MATTCDEHYPLVSIRFLKAMWGDGFLSPCRPEEVERLLSGVDLGGRTVVDIGSVGSGGKHVLGGVAGTIQRVLGRPSQITSRPDLHHLSALFGSHEHQYSPNNSEDQRHLPNGVALSGIPLDTSDTIDRTYEP